VVLIENKPLPVAREGAAMTKEDKYSDVQERIKAELSRWVYLAVPPGDFLTAVLRNNLKEAYARADEENLKALGAILRYLYWEVPAKCWGSEEKVDKWIEKKEADKGQK